MNKKDDEIIWKLLDLCRYIEWENVKNFNELEENKDE